MVHNIWISLIDIGVKANESRRVLERLDRWFVGPTATNMNRFLPHC